MAFPASHWRQLHSTNTRERVNREIERRTGVVGIFPNAQAALRLIGVVLEEQHEEWTEVRRHFSIESMALLYGKAEGLRRFTCLGRGRGGVRHLT